MENREEKEICLDCGAELVEKDGELVCPYCDAEIDFFGEEDEEVEEVEEDEESLEDLYEEELEEIETEDEE